MSIAYQLYTLHQLWEAFCSPTLMHLQNIFHKGILLFLSCGRGRFSIPALVKLLVKDLSVLRDGCLHWNRSKSGSGTRLLCTASDEVSLQFRNWWAIQPDVIWYMGIHHLVIDFDFKGSGTVLSKSIAIKYFGWKRFSSKFVASSTLCLNRSDESHEVSDWKFIHLLQPYEISLFTQPLNDLSLSIMQYPALPEILFPLMGDSSEGGQPLSIQLSVHSESTWFLTILQKGPAAILSDLTISCSLINGGTISFSILLCDRSWNLFCPSRFRKPIWFRLQIPGWFWRKTVLWHPSESPLSSYFPPKGPLLF